MKWRRLLPSVYCLDSSSPGPRQSLLAVLLWIGERGALSHRTAAHVWGLDGIRASIEVTMPSYRRPPAPGIIVHASVLGPGDVVVRDGLRVTSVERTLVDLSAVIEPEALERALDTALTKRLTTTRRVRRRLEADTWGTKSLKMLTRERAENHAMESELERRMLRLLKSAALPKPRRQVNVVDNGRFVARLDFAYPDVKVGIEVEGYAFHSGKSVWQADMQRLNGLTKLGWTVLRFSWDDVTRRPQEVAAQVRAALSLPINSAAGA